MGRVPGTPVRGYGLEQSVCVVTFWPDSTSDPVWVGDDEISDVTYVSTGLWKVQLKNTHRKAHVTTGLSLTTLATAGGIHHQVDSEASTTALSVNVAYHVAGTLTDLASNADNRISVAIFLEDSRAA